MRKENWVVLASVTSAWGVKWDIVFDPLFSVFRHGRSEEADINWEKTWSVDEFRAAYKGFSGWFVPCAKQAWDRYCQIYEKNGWPDPGIPWHKATGKKDAEYETAD